MRKLSLISKFSDVKNWETNNYNTHTAQHSNSTGNQPIKFGQLERMLHDNYLSSKSWRK